MVGLLLTFAPKPTFAATACDADVNNDGAVSMLDVNLVLAAVGATTGSPNYNPDYDLDNNGAISIADVSIVLSFVGQTCAANLLPTACDADVNKDGFVNQTDSNLVLSAFGASVGDPNFNPAYDLNKDNFIDLQDILIVNSFNGQTCAANLPQPTPCTYRLITTSITAGSSALVEIQIDTGDSGRFLGTISQGTTVITTGTRNGLGTLNIAAPGIAGSYTITAEDADGTVGGSISAFACTLSSGSNVLTVTASIPPPPTSCTISPSSILSPGSFYLTASGYTAGTSYPIKMTTGFGTSPVSLGNLTNPVQAVNVAAGTNPGLYVIFVTTSPETDLRCTPDLNINPPPPTGCTFSPTSILSPGSFYLTATGYTSGGYPVVMVDGFGGSVFSETIGNLTNPTQAFTIRSGISPGTYAIRITTAPGAFIQCAGGLNIDPPPPGDPGGGSTPGSLCPPYSTTGGFKISDFFQPARHFCNFGILSSDILTILISAAGALAFIFIIVGGIKLVTSSGDPKAIANARGTLTYAIIGLVVTILAFIIVQVVQFFLKAKVI